MIDPAPPAPHTAPQLTLSGHGDGPSGPPFIKGAGGPAAGKPPRNEPRGYLPLDLAHVLTHRIGLENIILLIDPVPAAEAALDLARLLACVELDTRERSLLAAVSDGIPLAEHAREVGECASTTRSRWRVIREKFRAVANGFGKRSHNFEHGR